MRSLLGQLSFTKRRARKPSSVAATPTPPPATKQTRRRDDLTDSHTAVIVDQQSVVQCSICCEEVAAPCPKATSSCTHAPRTCANCLQKHIKEEVVGKTRAHITCPAAGCNAAFTMDDIKRLAGAKRCKGLDRNLLNDYLKSQPDFRWCAHIGCGSGQLVEGSSSASFMTCHQCSRMSCVHHRTVWHSGRTCVEYDTWLQECTNNGEKDMAWIRANCTACPKCGHGIQKEGGCDHMTCRTSAGGCGHEFCWRCGADYALIRKHDNSYHKATCMYHS